MLSALLLLLALLRFPTLSFSEKVQNFKIADVATYVHVTHYDYTLPSQQCEGIITSEEYVIAGICIQTYSNASSLTVDGSYMLSVDSATNVIIIHEYTDDAACGGWSVNTTLVSNGACEPTGDDSFISISFAEVDEPALLPGLYYEGFTSLSDCQNEVSKPASYHVKYPTDQCSVAESGVYFIGSCLANGDMSYSMYSEPSCSGEVLSNGTAPLPGPPNHGCVSRVDLPEDIAEDFDTTNSASNWLRFYCGIRNDTFPSLASPTPMPAVVPTAQPTLAIAEEFTGYLMREFFTDSACLQPYKTLFVASGRCRDYIHPSGNSSAIHQFTILNNQVIHDVGFYSGLGCQIQDGQFTESTTPTTCSPSDYQTNGGYSRTDLYMIQTFLAGNATPSVSKVGIVQDSYFTSSDDCQNGVQPMEMTVYQNNSCFSSQNSYSFYYSEFNLCLPEGESYSLNVISKNSSGWCAASDKVLSKYIVYQKGPNCYHSGGNRWSSGSRYCGTTLPTQFQQPTLQPTVAIVPQLTGYAKQEFFTDPSCLHPYKTVFIASGRCEDVISSNYSQITQFTVVNNQMIKTFGRFSGLGCQVLDYRYTESTTPTTCSPYTSWSYGGDYRTDLYVTQSFEEETVTPSVSKVGIVFSGYFASSDDCYNGVQPTAMIVYQNNSCYSSYYSSSYYVSNVGVCLLQGGSYNLHVTSNNATSTCAASDKVLSKYYTIPKSPNCYSTPWGQGSRWISSLVQCGTTLPNQLTAAAAPSGVPTYTPPTSATVPPLASSTISTYAPTFYKKSSPTVTLCPSIAPTIRPSLVPPTIRPSLAPTFIRPTTSPSTPPSPDPTSSRPSRNPSTSSTTAPSSSRPSRAPTLVRPSSEPTTRPSIVSPSIRPSRDPSTRPTPAPITFRPSTFPTLIKPTTTPTTRPTRDPTSSRPSTTPTLIHPTPTPTTRPTRGPTSSRPSITPTLIKPTTTPTARPTRGPTSSRPSITPTLIKPTTTPTTRPTHNPSSFRPSRNPSTRTTHAPTTLRPSRAPSSTRPIKSPTWIPTRRPATAAPSLKKPSK